jgi:hypothetical protein
VSASNVARLTFAMEWNMNEYAVRLHDNQTISVFAFSRADIGDALQDQGISRNEVASVRLVDSNVNYRQQKPFVTSDSYADAA